MILGLLAAVVVAAVATVDDGAVDSGVGVDFVDGGSGGVTGVYTSTFVFFVGGTAGNELLASSSTTAAGADTVTGDNEAAASFFPYLALVVRPWYVLVGVNHPIARMYVIRKMLGYN